MFLFSCFLEANLAKSSLCMIVKRPTHEFSPNINLKNMILTYQGFFIEKKGAKIGEIIIPSGTYHKNLAIWILFV